MLCDQAYRPHVLDMFEPQDHPQDFEFPGGPPIKPYDITGYNLSYQMGVKYDRILDGFSGPFQPITEVMAPPPGKVVGSGGAGWILDHRANNSFTLTNRLQKAKVPVYWVKDGVTVGGQSFGPGSVWVPATGAAKAIVGKSVGELGINAYLRHERRATGREDRLLKAPRIGIVEHLRRRLITSGWMQWVVEQFEFPYTLVYGLAELDAGNLNAKYDARPAVRRRRDPRRHNPGRYGGGGGFGRGLPKPAQEVHGEVPQDAPGLRDGQEKSCCPPRSQAFIQAGGSAWWRSAAPRGWANIWQADRETAWSRQARTICKRRAAALDQVLHSRVRSWTAKVDNKDPLGFGFADHVDLFFDSEPGVQDHRARRQAQPR